MYSKERMGQFGTSIKVNRKKRLKDSRNASRWTQKEFCKDICAQNSLSSMEKGNPGRFADNYERFAEKLGLRCIEDPKVDKNIHGYTKHLYKAVEYYDYTMITKYVRKFMELLEPLKDCLWYGDLYQAVSVLDQHYLHQNYIPREDRSYFADMIGEFSEAWDDMLKSMIFFSAYLDVETDEFEKRFLTFNIEDNKAAFNKVNTLLYYCTKEYTTKFFALYETLEKEWKKKRNYLRLVDLYNQVLIYKSFFDASEVDDVRSKINMILNEFELPKYKLAETYLNLGIAYYNLKQYDKTIEMMRKCYESDAKRAYLSLLYLGHSQRKLDMDVTMPPYCGEELNKFPKYIRMIYMYYSLPSDYSADERETCLMTNVLPSLNPLDDAVINILREELELLVEETKHYKNLMIYDKKAKELLSHG